MLVFFVKHSEVWMNTLNHINLINDLTNFVDKIINFNNIKLLKFEKYIIPLMEKDMLLLYENNINAIMPDINAINTFSNKKLFYEYVIKNNLSIYIPKTYYSNDFLAQKYISKPYTNNNGNGIVFLQPYVNKNINDTIIQEYIQSNEEYVCFLVALNGIIIHYVAYKSIINKVNHIKSSYLSDFEQIKIDLDDKYLKIIELFLLPIKYNGVCNVDFKIINDEIKIFEINVRLGGTLMIPKYKNDLVSILKILLINYKELESGFNC